MLQESTLQKSMFIGFACAIATVILWSGNFVVARGLSDSIGPLTLSFWRWLVAVLFLMPFALKPLLKKKSWLKENKSCLALVHNQLVLKKNLASNHLKRNQFDLE